MCRRSPSRRARRGAVSVLLLLALGLALPLRAQDAGDEPAPQDDPPAAQAESPDDDEQAPEDDERRHHRRDDFDGLDGRTIEDVRAEQAGVSHASLDIGYANHGLSIGNSAVWHGVRLNWHDRGLRDVKGVNVTLWRPGYNVDGRIDAISLGLWGPRADVINGVSLGLVSVRARKVLRGVWVGGLAAEAGRMTGIGATLGAQLSRGRAHGLFVSGLANVSNSGDAEFFEAAFEDFSDFDDPEQDPLHLAGHGQGSDSLHGVAVAGLANVRNGGVHGIQVAGLANVGNGGLSGAQGALLANVVNGSVRGVQLGGLANVVNGSLHGIQAGGLANVHNGSVNGILLGGLANVSNGAMHGLVGAGITNVTNGGARGILVSGAANVSNGSTRGLFLSGIANVVHGDSRGVYLALGGLYASDLRGVGVGGLKAEVGSLRGVQMGLWNEVTDLRGLTVGLYNHATTVSSGVMLGLINHVPTNPGWAQWLPLVNASF